MKGERGRYPLFFIILSVSHAGVLAPSVPGIAGSVWGTELGGLGFMPYMTLAMWQISVINMWADGSSD